MVKIMLGAAGVGIAFTGMVSIVTAMSSTFQ